MREDIRIRVAGVYIEDNKILLVQHRKAGREYYLLPGGGQHTGETACDALIREWKEELDLDIVPGEFIFLGESIPPDVEERKHVYQLVFLVKSIAGKLELHADNTLVGHAWVSLNDLDQITLFPRCVQQLKEFLDKKPIESYTHYKWDN